MVVYMRIVLGVIYDSQATNKTAAVGGGSHGESSLLPMVAWESYMTPSPTATHLFITNRIRVKEGVNRTEEKKPALMRLKVNKSDDRSKATEEYT
jgi:hypothetical protein